MISGVVYLLRIFKMFHGLMNNPVLSFVFHFKISLTRHVVITENRELNCTLL